MSFFNLLSDVIVVVVEVEEVVVVVVVVVLEVVVVVVVVVEVELVDVDNSVTLYVKPTTKPEVADGELFFVITNSSI